MNNTINKHLLGAHLSISGGLHQAIIQAQKIGCTAVQFFSKSNRQWHAKPLEKTEIELSNTHYMNRASDRSLSTQAI